MRCPNLTSGKLNEAPGIIGISERGKISVYSSLADSCNSLDLLLRVCEVGLYVQKIPSSIDLKEV